MTRTYLSTEAIVLRAHPFRDSDQILTLFTAKAGIIKVICFGSRSQKSKWRSLCLPLTQVEIIYREKQGEIFECRDLSLIHPHHALKEHFHHLNAACDFLYSLNLSQMPGKEAPQLYELLIYFLHKIPLMSDPRVLTLSFRLKLLGHDGLLTCPFICHHCQQPILEQAFFSEGEWQCFQHQSLDALNFSEEELLVIYQLVSTKKFGDLVQITLPPDLKLKVELFFKAWFEGK